MVPCCLKIRIRAFENQGAGKTRLYKGGRQARPVEAAHERPQVLIAAAVVIVQVGRARLVEPHGNSFQMTMADIVADPNAGEPRDPDEFEDAFGLRDLVGQSLDQNIDSREPLNRIDESVRVVEEDRAEPLSGSSEMNDHPGNGKVVGDLERSPDFVPRLAAAFLLGIEPGNKAGSPLAGLLGEGKVERRLRCRIGTEPPDDFPHAGAILVVQMRAVRKQLDAAKTHRVDRVEVTRRERFVPVAAGRNAEVQRTRLGHSCHAMILTMLRKAASVWFLAVVAGSGTLRGQDVTAFVDRDIRLFAVSAAMNVAGFDVELAPRYHPVRQLLRESLLDVDEDLVRRLRTFYDEHRGDAPHEDQLASYVSLALNVSAPPAMAPLFDENLIPLDARDVGGFIPLVRELYSEANLTRLWTAVAPGYDVALDRLATPIRDALVQTEAYLRVPSGTVTGRRAIILVELSLPINSVNVRNYPDNLYIVLGDSAAAPIDVIRHGYLHVLLDPMLAVYREDDLARASELLDLLEGVEGVRAEYSGDFETMAGESLIRAVELRMDMSGTGDPTPDVDAAYREGLLLAPYFHEQLVLFEAGPSGLRQYLPEMIQGLDLAAEQERFGTRFSSIPVPGTGRVRADVPAAPPADPGREILREAQAAFNSGDDETARQLFSRVLEAIDPGNGAALYGMALIASRAQDRGLASEYFSRTIESGTAETSMVVWSHVYLGRIEDIACNREAALDHYRRALETGDDTGGAQDAARQAIGTPYGGNCG